MAEAGQYCSCGILLAPLTAPFYRSQVVKVSAHNMPCRISSVCISVRTERPSIIDILPSRHPPPRQGSQLTCISSKCLTLDASLMPFAPQDRSKSILILTLAKWS